MAATTNRKQIRMTAEDYRELREDYGGICLACGEENFGVEPDAMENECEACGANKVYGIEEAPLMGRVAIVED